jgi:NAD(P)-dependent dehydrogenase (short-subunit alcohol dehydrogenase family)
MMANARNVHAITPRPERITFGRGMKRYRGSIAPRMKARPGDNGGHGGIHWSTGVSGEFDGFENFVGEPNEAAFRGAAGIVSSKEQAMKPVCMVIGAGAGIGGNVGRRFAREGYHAVLCRRTDQEGLDRLVSTIEADGGSASGYLLNAVEPDSIEERIAAVENEIGPIEVLVFNLGAQIGKRSLGETTYKAFERGWRLATFGLFRAASAVAPHMERRGKGTILVTSATAAVRGNAGQHAHAAAMGGRRMLCQSLNAELAAKGIHVAHVIIDGSVDAPDTLGKLLGREAFQELRERRGLENDGLLLPEKIADTYFHLAQQHRSAWTHELDLRAFSDLAWWNH